MHEDDFFEVPNCVNLVKGLDYTSHHYTTYQSLNFGEIGVLDDSLVVNTGEKIEEIGRISDIYQGTTGISGSFSYTPPFYYSNPYYHHNNPFEESFEESTKDSLYNERDDIEIDNYYSDILSKEILTDSLLGEIAEKVDI